MNTILCRDCASFPLFQLLGPFFSENTDEDFVLIFFAFSATPCFQKVEEESDLGAASPPYPVVVRVPPRQKTPPPEYETEPLKNVRYSQESASHRASSHMESSI